MHQESYEAVSRAPGSFAQFRRGVDLLLERKVPFVVKGALLPPNRAEMDEFEAWAATIPWMDQPRAIPCSSICATVVTIRPRTGSSSRCGVSPEEGLAVLTRDEAEYRKEMAEFAAKFMGPAGDRLFACGAGHGSERRCLWPRPAVHGRARARADCGRPYFFAGGGSRVLRNVCATCGRPTPSTCAAAPAAFSRVCASSARPNRGRSTGRWTRRWNTSVRWLMRRRVAWAGWARVSMHGKSRLRRIL